MKTPTTNFFATLLSRRVLLAGAIILTISGSAPNLFAQSAAASSQADANANAGANANANASSHRPSDNPQFPAVAADAPMSPRAAARVQVNGRNFDLEPNKIGHLPRVHVEPSTEIPISMVFDKGKENEPVTVQVEDGGQLDTKTMAKIARMDGKGKVNFKYRVTAEPGSFRVVVRRGSEVKVFDFWVGPPLPVAPLETATAAPEQ